MSYTLMEGALAKIYAQEDYQNAVVQILGHKRINVRNEWIRLISFESQPKKIVVVVVVVIGVVVVVVHVVVVIPVVDPRNIKFG